MKRTISIIISGALILSAQTPTFKDEGFMKDNQGNELKHSSGVQLKNLTPNPCVVDWDNDGDMDLIVGAFDSRNSVLYFENSGTAKNPVLKAGETMYAGGVPIALSAG